MDKSNFFGLRLYASHLTEPKTLTRQLMLPLGFLVFAMTILGGVLFYQQYSHYLHDSANAAVSELTHDMDTLINEQSSALSLAIKPIANDPAVHQALREGNAQKLLMQWQGVFERMKEENQLTHFYFLDKNRICLLRVHKPAKRGDIINRFTAMEAEWNRKISSGVEIGPLGTLTLRVVQPVIVDNEVIGYIELGKEIEDVLSQLHYKSNIDVAVIVRKSHLKRSAWEDGMRLLQRDGNWNLFLHDALIYSSFEKLPRPIWETISAQTSPEHQHEEIDQEVSADGNTYRVSISAIHDVSGQEVGDLVVINNLTKEHLEFFDMTIIGGMIGLVLTGGILFFMYSLFRRTDEGIKNQQQALYENQQRLEQLARHSRTYAWEVDDQGMYTYVSDVVHEVLGYESEELIGKYFYDLHPVNGKEEFKKAAFEVLERKEAFGNLKNRVMNKKGEILWVMTNGFPILSNEGRVLGYRGNDTDITLWQKAEESIIESRNLLNEAQHFARMGSWSLDLIRNDLVWSDEVFRIFEIDANHFGATYEAFLDRIFPEDREMVNHAYLHSLETQEPYEVIHRLLMEDGRIKWVHEIGMSEFDEEGKAIRSMGTVQDISERKIAEEEINRLAFFDPLTELPNRTLLIDRLNQARILSDRSAQFHALLFIDLDNFKTLNDTLGHEMGDNLLKQTSLRLKGSVREGDSVSRFGGDEFVILLTGLGNNEAHAAASCELIGEKILAALNQPYELDGISYQSTASIGVTLFRGDALSDAELMKQADLAMYKSKEAGRNALSFFDPKMETSLKERAILEEEIRRGVETEQFCLYYQPQLTHEGDVYGAEALIRWNHPKRGLVSPAEFIPIAEETGLILPLGQWVMKTACTQIARWSEQEMFKDLTIAINVSARQFNQKDFVEQVIGILEESGADSSRLKLELTESILIQNVEEVIGKMERLKSYGVRFSLDDFGTGYSSLSYLKRLPLDQLKIDKSFVRDILSDPNDAIICKSTIVLAENMGLSVIAEGVETKEQFEVLLSFGCQAYQGYWFGRPLSLEMFETFQRNKVTEYLGR